MISPFQISPYCALSDFSNFSLSAGRQKKHAPPHLLLPAEDTVGACFASRLFCFSMSLFYGMCNDLSNRPAQYRQNSVRGCSLTAKARAGSCVSPGTVRTVSAAPSRAYGTCPAPRRSTLPIVLTAAPTCIRSGYPIPERQRTKIPVCRVVVQPKRKQFLVARAFQNLGQHASAGLSGNPIACKQHGSHIVFRYCEGEIRHRNKASRLLFLGIIIS